MAFTRISDSELNSRGATTLPNQPAISADALKAEFDAPAKQVVAPKVNGLMNELEASSSAASLGAVAPTGFAGGTVQAVINSVAGEVETVAAQTHSHSNKAVLDKFSEVSGDPYYDGNPIGGNTGNYESLTNLPKINNVTLTGNKTTSDLGLPTTLAAMGDDSTHRVVTDVEKSTWNGKSVVEVTQVQTTGTKVATISVNGAGTDIYAPSGGGGGSVNDAYKTIKVGQTSISASGEDTFEFVEGSNVTLTPDATNKKITISASGGGQSTGDMLSSDYDSDYDVKTAGGIKAYVASQAYSLPIAGSSTLGGVKINGNNLSIDGNGVLSATDTTYTSKAESQGGTAVSLCTTGEKYEWNHKTDENPSFTMAGSRTNISTGESYSTMLGKIAKWFNDLKDLAFVAKDGTSSTKYLQGDGTWQTFPTIPTVNDGTFTVKQNGTSKGSSTANQSTASEADIITDEWKATTTTVSSGAFTFTGLDDTKGYGFKPYVQVTGSSTNKNPTCQISGITGAGTSNMSVSYTTDADNGATVKLRIVK